MYTALFRLQQGLISPYSFKEDQINHRSFNLQLSKQKDIQNTFEGAVKYLDLEDSEERYLLSGCLNGSIYIHDLHNFYGEHQYSAKCVASFHRQASKSVECVTWFPNDNRLFVSSGNETFLMLWDANTKASLSTFRTHGRVFRHAWCPHTRNLIAVASQAKIVDLLDHRTGNISHELRGHDDSVTNVAWSPRYPGTLVTGGRDSRVFMWDVRSAAGPLYHLNWKGSGRAHRGHINSIAFTLDGLHVITYGNDRNLKTWETSSGKSLLVNFEQLSKYPPTHVQMAVGKNVIYMPNRGKISVLNIRTGETAGDLCGHYDTVMCCVYRQSYQELYSGGVDRNVLIWTAEGLTNNDGITRIKLPNYADAWSSDES